MDRTRREQQREEFQGTVPLSIIIARSARGGQDSLDATCEEFVRKAVFSEEGDVESVVKTVIQSRANRGDKYMQALQKLGDGGEFQVKGYAIYRLLKEVQGEERVIVLYPEKNPKHTTMWYEDEDVLKSTCSYFPSTHLFEIEQGAKGFEKYFEVLGKETGKEINIHQRPWNEPEEEFEAWVDEHGDRDVYSTWEQLSSEKILRKVFEYQNRAAT